jgi:hypothetical protein
MEAKKQVKAQVVKAQVVKAKKTTIREFIDVVYMRQQKDIKTGSKLVLDNMFKAGQTTNIRGGAITLDKITSHTKNYFRDIKTERKGHWSLKKVIETKEGITVEFKQIINTTV